MGLLLLFFSRGSLLQGFAPSGSVSSCDLFRRIHCLAAVGGSAVAAGFVVVAVVQVVIVGQLFTRGDVAQRHYPHPAVQFIRLAIWVAGMIDVHRHPMAATHLRSAPDTEEVGDG